MIIYTHLGKPFDILLIDQLLLLHFAVRKGGLVPGAQWIMIFRANPNKQSSCGDCVAGMMWIQLDKCNRSIIWRNSRPVEWPLVPPSLLCILYEYLAGERFQPVFRCRYTYRCYCIFERWQWQIGAEIVNLGCSEICLWQIKLLIQRINQKYVRHYPN